jgi:hypothetical protein
MFRRHWREPAFWRWWWGNRASYGAKVSLTGVAVAAFLAVGFLAAVSLSEADAGSVGTGALTFETTVDRLVTVREHGRVVIRRVPVVRRVVFRPQTAFRTLFDTRLITTKGGVRYVPVVRKRVVTVNGKTRTITETRLVPTTKTQTQTQTQTQTNVVTQEQTVVVTRTDTLPVTVQETVVETQTLPPVTVTETLPMTVTVTVPTATLP